MALAETHRSDETADSARAPAAVPAVVARGLKKNFGSVQAVRGVDLVVPRGSCFGLIGENGAGKTSFIKLLLGIARPSAGTVQVLGGSPDDVSVRQRIGYLPERLTLPPAFTPLSFLASVGRMKGLSASVMHTRLPQLLSEVGLDEVAWKRRMGNFSKGMKQRTGLAAALVGEPDLLVLDEPTDGIDPVGRGQIRDVILRAQQRGCTVFLNSHLLAETERICDHVAVMSAGAVVVSGPLASLRSKDAFRVRFDVHTLHDDTAQAHGFRPVDVATGSYRYVGHDAVSLSHALTAVLAAGFVVLEISPELRDLESILREAITARRASEVAA